MYTGAEPYDSLLEILEGEISRYENSSPEDVLDSILKVVNSYVLEKVIMGLEEKADWFDIIENLKVKFKKLLPV